MLGERVGLGGDEDADVGQTRHRLVLDRSVGECAAPPVSEDG